MTVVEPLLTADEYGRLSDDGPPTELIRGKVVPRKFTTPLHGLVCSNIVLVFGEYQDQTGCPWRMCSLSGLVTHRNPDSVRSADFSAYSPERLPKGPLPDGYLSVLPELAFEVQDVAECWPDMIDKATEFLQAGVLVVGVLDPRSKSLTVFREEQPLVLLQGDDELALPDILPDFRVPVRRFFE